MNKNKVENYLNLKLDLGNLNIELKGNYTTSFIKEIRKIIEIYISEVGSEYEYYTTDDLDLSLVEISPDLKRKPEFRRIISDLFYSEEDHYIKKISIKNIIEIRVDKNKDKILKVSLNKQEWKKNLNELFSQINYKKLSYAIVHIMTSIDQQDLDYLIDLIKRNLFFVPIKLFITKKENLNNTSLELILFGHDFIKINNEE